jgi:hypothetical protein
MLTDTIPRGLHPASRIPPSVRQCHIINCFPKYQSLSHQEASNSPSSHQIARIDSLLHLQRLAIEPTLFGSAISCASLAAITPNLSKTRLPPFSHPPTMPTTLPHLLYLRLNPWRPSLPPKGSATYSHPPTTTSSLPAAAKSSASTRTSWPPNRPSGQHVSSLNSR